MPGAGWIGLDPTSGLLAGEGHIPLACTPDPPSAAPITGATERGEVDLRLLQRRLAACHEDPRVTAALHRGAVGAPSTRSADAVDDALAAGDVRLTMGGEPTFVSVDDMDGGGVEHRRRRADEARPGLGLTERLIDRLRDRFAPAASSTTGRASGIPGEPLPRWQIGVLLAGRRRAAVDGPDAAGRTGVAGRDRRRRRGRGPSRDGAERRGGPGIGSGVTEGDDRRPGSRRRMPPLGTRPTTASGLRGPRARAVDRGVAPARPRRPTPGPHERRGAPRRRPRARRRAGSSPSTTSRRRPPDERGGPRPAGYLRRGRHLPGPRRLAPRPAPAARLADVAEPEPLPPTGRRSSRTGAPLGPAPVAGTTSWPAARAGGEVLPPAKAPHHRAVRRTCATDGCTCSCRRFAHLEDAVELLAAVEARRGRRRRAGGARGLPAAARPPAAPVRRHAPTPASSRSTSSRRPRWAGAGRHVTEPLYEEARQARLGTEKFDARRHATPAPAAATTSRSAAPTPADSPLLRRPDLLRSLVTYWQHHPSLSYLFSGPLRRPDQPGAPRRRGPPRQPLRARDRLRRARPPRPTSDRRRRGWSTGCCATCSSTSPATPTAPSSASTSCSAPTRSAGRLGLVELRGVRDAAAPADGAGAGAARAGARRPLLATTRTAGRWCAGAPSCTTGSCCRTSWPPTSPTCVDDLRAPRLPVRARPGSTPFLEFRFPRLGTVDGRRRRASSCATAIEPWHVLGEEVGRRRPPPATSTPRSSGSRCRVEGLTAGRHVVTCNGVPVPLRPTGTPGTSVAGVRFRAWQPPSALHPTIGVHTPAGLRPRGQLERPRRSAGCTYHVAHPGGRAYDTLPGERQRGRGPPRQPLPPLRPHARAARHRRAAAALADHTRGSPSDLALRRSTCAGAPAPYDATPADPGRPARDRAARRLPAPGRRLRRDGRPDGHAAPPLGPRRPACSTGWASTSCAGAAARGGPPARRRRRHLQRLRRAARRRRRRWGLDPVPVCSPATSGRDRERRHPARRAARPRPRRPLRPAASCCAGGSSRPRSSWRTPASCGPATRSACPARTSSSLSPPTSARDSDGQCWSCWPTAPRRRPAPGYAMENRLGRVAGAARASTATPGSHRLAPFFRALRAGAAGGGAAGRPTTRASSSSAPGP